MSDIEYANRLKLEKNPSAPQGPSNEELNRIPPDPYIPPFGGSASLLSDLVCGPYMDPDKATAIMVHARK